MFQFVPVEWRPLVITMATAVMICLAPENVNATKASREVPVNSVAPTTMVPTAQVTKNAEMQSGSF